MSRIILETLGVTDYGVYSVVGGFATLFSFFSTSLSNATQRYLNFSLGNEDYVMVRKVYSQSIILYFLFSLFTLILGIIIGQWFVDFYLKIPADRIYAAKHVLYSTVLSAVILINEITFIGTIIANERMTAFAYISMLDVTCRLLIVLWVGCIKSADTLILYTWLLTLVHFLIFCLYVIYCKFKFRKIHFGLCWEKKLIMSMSKFIGYNLFGCFFYTAASQGINIVYNIFFGVVLNAANAIATQVNGAVYKFSDSIMTAVKPQIIKLYAKNDIHGMLSLVINSSRISFYLVLFFVLPLMFETEYVLKLWLGTPPECAVLFTRLLLIDSIINVLINPLWISANATGNIKNIQVYGRALMLLSLPLSYVLLLICKSPAIPLLTYVFSQFLYWLYNIHDIHRQVNLNVRNYLKKILLSLIRVIIPTGLILFMVHSFMEIGFIRLATVILATLITECFLIIFLDMSKSELDFAKNTLKQIIAKFKKS